MASNVSSPAKGTDEVGLKKEEKEVRVKPEVDSLEETDLERDKNLEEVEESNMGKNDSLANPDPPYNATSNPKPDQGNFTQFIYVFAKKGT